MREFIRKNRSVIGYAFLVIILLGCFAAIQNNREVARQAVIEALTISCNRTNELTDQRAADIYDDWDNLDRNAKALSIPLTRQLRELVRQSSNDSLRSLNHYDCTVLPPNKPKKISYPLIKAGKPSPKFGA